MTHRPVAISRRTAAALIIVCVLLGTTGCPKKQVSPSDDKAEQEAVRGPTSDTSTADVSPTKPATQQSTSSDSQASRASSNSSRNDGGKKPASVPPHDAAEGEDEASTPGSDRTGGLGGGSDGGGLPNRKGRDPRSAEKFGRRLIADAQKAAAAGQQATAYEKALAAWQATASQKDDEQCRRIAEQALQLTRKLGESLNKSAGSQDQRKRIKVQ